MRVNKTSWSYTLVQICLEKLFNPKETIKRLEMEASHSEERYVKLCS